MANNDSIGPGSLLVAFVLGAAAGAAFALLYAPAAGDEAREYLGTKAREGRAQAADAAKRSREFLNRQRENLTTAFEGARAAYQAAAAEKDPGA
jgi:gas vesicle protein